VNEQKVNFEYDKEKFYTFKINKNTLRKNRSKYRESVSPTSATRSKIAQAIPSIDNFSEFKRWLLAQLESLE